MCSWSRRILLLLLLSSSSSSCHTPTHPPAHQPAHASAPSHTHSEPGSEAEQSMDVQLHKQMEQGAGLETPETQETPVGVNSSFQARIHARMELVKNMKEEEKLYRYNGVLYPVIMSPEENLRALESVEAREDDIMLVAYPKCGFNWMVAVLRKIMSAASGVKAESKMPPLMEFFGSEALQFLQKAPSPRLLGTHMHPDNIPASFFQKKTKMLVVFRNPKDTMVSFYHFSSKNPVLATPESWDQFYTDFMSGEVPWGSYFDHALAWEKYIDDPSVMIITFEELKQDLSGGVQRVAEFFGYSLTDDQIQSIAEESTFNAMREGSKDSHGQMGKVFFRKGEIGDWRNHFSDVQSEEMDAAFKKHLEGTKLGARLQYDLHCK
ncbi:sulfotransferase 6B1 [Astyanax mexicanus]|uniref:sulfotransferase 6B1 n=1 Tax=Astyanax mexicanus TaxID=7994 RepID=UPI0020CAC74D|nr:sulfotransferase 6B1 [Astyanax mexicanus]